MILILNSSLLIYMFLSLLYVLSSSITMQTYRILWIICILFDDWPRVELVVVVLVFAGLPVNHAVLLAMSILKYKTTE